MAIFSRPSRFGGKPVDGMRMECDYVGTNGQTRKIVGVVKSQRKIEGRGASKNLLVLELEGGGFRSLYFERATNVQFYSVRSTPTTEGEAYDAWKDRQLTG